MTKFVAATIRGHST